MLRDAERSFTYSMRTSELRLVFGYALPIFGRRPWSVPGVRGLGVGDVVELAVDGFQLSGKRAYLGQQVHALAN